MDRLYECYEEMLLRALRLRATAAKQINVLQHMLGCFKKQLDADKKAEFLELVERYRKADVPRVVPLTLMNHFVRKYDQPYLRRQIYLEPRPLELRLRST